MNSKAAVLQGIIHAREQFCKENHHHNVVRFDNRTHETQHVCKLCGHVESHVSENKQPGRMLGDLWREATNDTTPNKLQLASGRG